MTSPLISVIVPVYNCENYLRKCLDSLLNQTFLEFEVIIVDDGSTDDTAEICQAYHTRDARIRYHYQENAGVSVARNRGFDHAKGLFITFVDGDDWVDDNYLEVLWTKMKEHDADIVVANYYEFREWDSVFLFHVFQEEPDKVFEPTQVFWDYYFTLNFDDISMNGVLSKLFKKELLKTIRFNESIRMAEDAEFMYRLYLAANRIVVSSAARYCYLRRLGSLSSNIDTVQLSNLLQVHEERIAVLSLLGYETTSASNLYKQVINVSYAYMKDNEKMQQSQVFNRIEQLLHLTTR